ncbi:MAG TPA: helix-turn-helix transcriptional regulator [Elusimicrobiota bacterium]|jgi:transcriptional regulator with XRE-family HTH domain|nr:helix-turn-helix transcriptional regulator [Elusimicrobiota bacterium]
MSATLLSLIDPAETGKAAAERLRTLRLLKGWTRETLAKRAGVSAASLKRFENTGQASLNLVLRAAHALARLEEFDKLFRSSGPRSLADLERRASEPIPRRGRI